MFQMLSLWVGLMAPGGGEAKLLLTVEPEEAAVMLDGKKLSGFESGKAMAVKPGTFTLTVEYKGYEPEKRRIELTAGEQTKLSVRLERIGSKTGPVVAGKPGFKKGDLTPPKPDVRPTTKPRDDSPVTRKPEADKKPDVDAKPDVDRKPATKKPDADTPFGRKPEADKKPQDRPADKKADDGPFTRKPTAGDKDRDPIVKKPGGTVKPKPDDDRPRAKPGSDGGKKPRPKSPDDRRRPVDKPGTAGGGTSGDYGAQPAARDEPTDLRPFAALSFAIGGLAITGGVIAGISANEKAEEFNRSVSLRQKQTLKDETESRALVSNVLYGVGATGVLVGALLWAMSPDESHYATAAPLPGGGAMVGFGGTF